MGVRPEEICSIFFALQRRTTANNGGHGNACGSGLTLRFHLAKPSAVVRHSSPPFNPFCCCNSSQPRETRHHHAKKAQRHRHPFLQAARPHLRARRRCLPRFANPHHPEGGQDVRLRLSRPSHRQGQCFTIGRYPDVPLARARELANDARKAVAKGDTPIKVEHAAAQKKIQPTPTWSRSMTKPTL
jgi:hypothetical protein